MRRRGVVVIGICALVAGAASCGLDLAGLDAVETDGGSDATADGTGPGVDASSDGGGANDGSEAGGDDGPSDAPLEIGPCPGSSLPLCDVDAAVCVAGTKCTPPVPAGWKIVSVETGSCAAPYPTPLGAGLVAFVTPPAVCGCTCAQDAGPSCASTGTISAGAACGTAAPPAMPTDNSCQAFTASVTLAATDGVKVVVAETPAACSANQTITRPTFDGGHREVCQFAGTGLCDNHSFCAPTTGTGACVAASGSQSCPAGFPKILATGATDGRGCTSCVCGNDPGHCTGTVTLDNGPSCNQSPFFPSTYDGTCVLSGSGNAGTYAKVHLDTASPVGGGCNVANVGTPNGMLTPTGVVTVCCRP